MDAVKTSSGDAISNCTKTILMTGDSKVATKKFCQRILSYIISPGQIYLCIEASCLEDNPIGC